MNMKYIRIGLTVVLIAAFSIAASGTAHAGVLSSVGKVLGSATSLLKSTKCLNGEVVSMSKKAITVKYKSRSTIVRKAFSMTTKQFDKATGRSITPGSQVKVCAKGSRVQGNVVNRAPAGQEATYGSTNAGGGGGGGGGT